MSTEIPSVQKNVRSKNMPAPVIVPDADAIKILLLAMKKIISLITLFIIYTAIINFCPVITDWDRSFIIQFQALLKNAPVAIPLLCDCALYSIMIVIPIIGMSIFFIKQKQFISAVLFACTPLLTFILNCIIKPLVHRPRPPYELQLAVHPESYSYVSSHSLVTCCLWSLVIYYTNKFCQPKWLKISINLIAVLWILFVGSSRIWIGVHNPTDVLGAYILAFILIFSYIKIGEKL